MINELSEKEEYELLKLSQQLVKLGTWSLDLVNNRLSWSDEVYEIFEIDRQTFGASYEAFVETIHPEDRKSVHEAYQASVDEKIAYKIEHRLLMKDGRIKYVEEQGKTYYDGDGNPIRSIGTVLDITERVLHQQASLKSNERYTTLIQTMKEGYWLVNMKGYLIDANDAYCSLSGYTREELLTMHISDLEVKESKDDIGKHIQKVISERYDNFETRHRKKNGQVWNVEISVTFSEIDGGCFYGLCRDITERKQLQMLTRLRSDLNQVLYTGNRDTLLQTALNVAEQITYSSLGFFHLLEQSKTISYYYWSSNRHDALLDNEMQFCATDKSSIWDQAIDGGGPIFANSHTDDHTLECVREVAIPVYRDGVVAAVIGVGNKQEDYDEADAGILSEIAQVTLDLLEREQVQRRIEDMAYYDPLTKLPNRKLFHDRLEQAMTRCQRMNELLGICYLDLDGFKPVNDQYGHHIGDELLKEVGKRLTEVLREGDTVARLGGDEFAILLTTFRNTYEAEEVIQRIMDTILVPFEIDEYRLHLSCSIGVTIYPLDDVSSEKLIRHADQAMYISKNTGKAIYTFFDTVENERVHTHRKLLDEFSSALHNDELELYYQPKIDLRSGELIGVEGLIRWNHPKHGFMMPGEFLPVIDNSPQEIALGEWVVMEALKQIDTWHAQGLKISISVNITPKHLQMETFVDFLEAELAKYPEYSAKYLELEILEIAAIRDTAKVERNMNRCSRLGVRFSLDDFGTGYSSLTYFHRLPIDLLKIDQNFVREMLVDSRDLDIVEGVLHLADALQRPVVAEGVESLEIGLMLHYLGCKYAQGYGIARPMPASKILDWSKAWESETTWHELGVKKTKQFAAYDLNVAIFSHRMWMKQIIDRVKGVLTEGDYPELHESKCQFGKWYNGTGKVRYGNRNKYDQIADKHHEVHVMAQTIKEMMDTGRSAQAEARLENFKSVSDDLLVLMDEMFHE